MPHRVHALGALLVLASFLTPRGARAQESLHDLQEELPTRLEDAIASEGVQVQALTRYRRTRDDRHLFDLEPTVQWGWRAGTYLQVSSVLVAGPGERSNSGDVQVLALHQLNKEGRAPAFAVSICADAPTGRESAGVDTRLKGIMTKDAGPQRRPTPGAPERLVAAQRRPRQ
jgi:hypothetical protein